MPIPDGKLFRPSLFLSQVKERALKMKANSDMIVIMVFFSVALPLIVALPLLLAKVGMPILNLISPTYVWKKSEPDLKFPILGKGVFNSFKSAHFIKGSALHNPRPINC
jgi:hypothetical protein